MLSWCRLFLVDLLLLVQDQESGSWGQYDWRFDGSECSAWRAGTDVHHPEGAPTHHDTNTLLDVLEAILTECCSLYAYGHYSLPTRWSVKLFCCRPATSRSKTSLQHSGRHNVATRSTISTGKSCKSKPVTFNWKPLGRTELRETLLHNFCQETNVERLHWSFTNLQNTTKDSDYRELSPSGGRSSNCISPLYRYNSLRYDKTVSSIYIFKLCVSCCNFSCLRLICCWAEKHTEWKRMLQTALNKSISGFYQALKGFNLWYCISAVDNNHFTEGNDLGFYSHEQHWVIKAMERVLVSVTSHIPPCSCV